MQVRSHLKLATRTLLASFCLAVATVMFAGCAAKSEDDSTLPWSRPASWEGGLPGVAPGMGGSGGF